jgi:hypothetical protein
MALATQVLECSGYRGALAVTFAAWTVEKRTSVLEILRSGTLTSELRTEISAFTPESVFRTVKAGSLVRQNNNDADKLATMIEIASKYSLTAQEFEYYCCISSPPVAVQYFIPPTCYPSHMPRRYGGVGAR